MKTAADQSLLLANVSAVQHAYWC